MPETALADVRLRALALGATACDIRDGKPGGFGVRVLPSGGKRFFVHCRHRVQRIWRIVGDRLVLARAKTGSRTVPPGSQARDIPVWIGEAAHRILTAARA